MQRDILVVRLEKIGMMLGGQDWEKWIKEDKEWKEQVMKDLEEIKKSLKGILEEKGQREEKGGTLDGNMGKGVHEDKVDVVEKVDVVKGVEISEMVKGKGGKCKGEESVGLPEVAVEVIDGTAEQRKEAAEPEDKVEMEKLHKEVESRRKESEELREKNLVVKGIKGDGWSARMEMRRILEKVFGEEVEVVRMEDRRNGAGEGIMIVMVGSKEERQKVLQLRGRLREEFGVVVDEDLSYEDRRLRWRIKIKAVEERRAGKMVVEEPRRIGIDGAWWTWVQAEVKWVRDRSEELPAQEGEMAHEIPKEGKREEDAKSVAKASQLQQEGEDKGATSADGRHTVGESG